MKCRVSRQTRTNTHKRIVQHRSRLARQVATFLFQRERLLEIVLFPLIKELIYRLLLLTCLIIRYCSSNLNLFHAQIRHICQRVKMSFKIIAYKIAFCSNRTSTKLTYYSHLLTLKLQISAKILPNVISQAGLISELCAPKEIRCLKK